MSIRTALPRVSLLAALALSSTLIAGRTSAQDCTSFDPADWPAPSRPYFMLAVDTSGSMTACTAPASIYPTTCNPNTAIDNSCGLLPTRYNDAKCALEQTVLAFSGQVNFGLSTFASYIAGCPGNCVANPTGTCATNPYNNCGAETFGCDAYCFQAEITTTGGCGGCGPRTGAASTRAGAYIRVPMLQDHFWSNPPAATNIDDLLDWTDTDCGGGEELYAAGATPLNGILRDMRRYFGSSWTHPDNPGITYTTPLAAQDLVGPGINGSTGCRSVNVILITDGDETCDGQADAVAAATALYQTGVTVGGKVYKIRTHVINFAGGTQANTDAIAAAGGTGSSIFANNEVELAQALADIVSGAAAPEICNNSDDNCNGCVDEGYKHYCNVQQACCAWSTQAQRTACIASYEASVANNPPGDTALLPCITQAQQTNPASWLCHNPGDECDEVDNNCQDGTDEGQLKCGNPPHCPTAEVCNGEDDDCDYQVDEGDVCGTCTPSPEICDGCDNDCDGIVDNGTFPTLDCGLPSPPNCDGTMSCEPPQPVAQPGTCLPGAGYGDCNNDPQPDVCDGIDNNCNGLIDDGFVSSTCEPPQNPPGLVYDDVNPLSACSKGTTQCINGAVQCVGGTGPSAEVCDGIDNDCDGFVDADDPGGVFGAGQQCGINNPPCQPGLTACVNGALVCQGGVPPQPEVCDGIDNDCDAFVDEAPLADAPLPGQQGCWNLPGNCCNHGSLSWCPPPGASCYANGALGAPCNRGTITCSAGAWICVGPVQPSPEVCDGVDNDCVNGPDDGNPGGGGLCGTDVGECQEGIYQCVNGSLDCVGSVGPSAEVCDGLDNDCDGTVDDNVPNGGECDPPYDAVAYPDSDLATPPCQKGVLVCDGAGNMVCQGGVGPTPEVCDGVDNDCDGTKDEAGAPPNGIDGSANPLPPPNASIGDACGNDVGVCAPGAYACLNGLFACLGGSGPVFESCNCLDDDCDGSTDEIPGPGEPVLCSPGKDCVQGSDFCQCAAPCGSGEFPCPAGQICQVLENSQGQTGSYCVTDFTALCGDCATKTTSDGEGNVLCAPAGTDEPGCLETPACVCKGQAGCHEPCFNVACSSPQVCSNFGPTPGTCVDDSCFLTGCPGCNRACHAGACIDNPCLPDSCPGETAKPADDWLSCDCVPSCADVDCGAAEKCVDGVCIDWCPSPCGEGQVCDPAILDCIDSQCTPASCPDGSWCNPINGQCSDDPCTGVVCPSGQRCEGGSCYDDGGGGSGGTGGGTGGGSTGGGSTGGGTTSSSSGGGTKDQGAYGLPSGGGGCLCDLGQPRRGNDHAWLGLVGLALAVARRRSSRQERRAR